MVVLKERVHLLWSEGISIPLWFFSGQTPKTRLLLGKSIVFLFIIPLVCIAPLGKHAASFHDLDFTHSKVNIDSILPMTGQIFCVSERMEVTFKKVDTL